MIANQIGRRENMSIGSYSNFAPVIFKEKREESPVGKAGLRFQ